MIITIELDGKMFTFEIHDVTIYVDDVEEAEEFDLDEHEIIEDENGGQWIYDEEHNVWYFYDAEEDVWLLDDSEDDMFDWINS